MTATTACYSIVVPALNEAESLPSLIISLTSLMDRLDAPAEVIVVDDGSTDATQQILRAAQAVDPRFSNVRLSRNFGHQVALTAGLERATGSAVITMDADGQHPPEVVLEMATAWREGFDVAYGVMVERRSESRFKRASSNGFYKVIRRLSDVPMPSNAGDFRLMDRAVVDAFLRMPERGRYLRGMVSWLGFRQVGIPYACAARQAGRSSYTLSRMLRFATDALLSFSTWPLRAGLALGFFVSGFAILFGLATIAMRLTAGAVPGWATIVVVASFLGGVQLTILGIVGEYVGRIYEEVKQRPLYVVHSERAPAPTGSPDQPTNVTAAPLPPASLLDSGAAR